MPDELTDLTIAILATHGVEQVELEQPRTMASQAGAQTDLISLEPGEIQATHSDIHLANKFPVDKVINDVSTDDYDALILPGGTTIPDHLRQSAAVVSFVQEMMAAGKPIAAICHGPWTLVEADVVRDRTLTSYPSIRTDIRNAGGRVVNADVVVDAGLVTSRTPDDLPAFCRAMIKEFAEAGRPVASGTTGR